MKKVKGQSADRISVRWDSTRLTAGEGGRRRTLKQTASSWYYVHHFSKVASLASGNFSTPKIPLLIMCKLRLTKMPSGADESLNRSKSDKDAQIDNDNRNLRCTYADILCIAPHCGSDEMARTWFGEICYCCSLTVLLGLAWVLLSYVLQTILGLLVHIMDTTSSLF